MERYIRGTLLLAAIVGTSSVAAAAGTHQFSDVTVEKAAGSGAQPWTASGSFGSTRNGGTMPAGTVKEIGCKIDTYPWKQSLVTCWAFKPLASGGGSLNGQCSSRNAAVVQAATSITTDSKITFQWYDVDTDYGFANECTALTVENFSSYEPKQ